MRAVPPRTRARQGGWLPSSHLRSVTPLVYPWRFAGRFPNRPLCSSTPNWQGEGWWSNEMINITGTAGDEDDNDCAVEMDQYYTLNFTNTATGTDSARV